MVRKRIKRPGGGKILQEELPFLWPDESGLLKIPLPSSARSSESRSRPWRPWPCVARVGALRLPRSRSLSLWLLERSLVEPGFFVENASRFENWLSGAILEADFQALSVRAVIEGAESQLHLERDVILRLLIQCTSSQARFRSSGGIVTLTDS